MGTACKLYVTVGVGVAAPDKTPKASHTSISCNKYVYATTYTALAPYWFSTGKAINYLGSAIHQTDDVCQLQ